MNVIFLDVDGVLNDFATMLFTDRSLNDEKLEMIGSLCEDQKCKIVLSTSWRHGMDEETLECEPNSATALLVRELRSKGCEIIGRTGDSQSDRGALIKKYVAEKLSPEDRFLIIDDEDVTKCQFTKAEHPDLEPHMLRTSAMTGMTYEDYKKAVRFFEGNEHWRECSAKDFILY